VTDQVDELLGTTAIFGGLDAPARRRLAQTARLCRLKRGEIVFHRGDRGGGMFVVARGSVALVVNAANGNEIVLDVIRPPRTFGEMAVVDGGPRIATAQVREPSVLIELARAEVLRLIDDNRVALAMLGALAETVRRVDNQAADLVLLDLRGRVAKYLYHAAGLDRDQRPVAPLVPIDLGLSQSELAKLVGGSRQQLNRILSELTDAGAIVRDGSSVVAVRPTELTRWIDAE
jgi:CRP-like cAMP-binding protein